MRILIIGGTGVISTPIARSLIKRGDEVTLYNRGNTVPRLPAGYKVMEGDRFNHAEFEKQVQSGGNFDCIIDMFCFKPAEAESLVRACRDITPQVIFCSTVAVYANAKALPIAEHEPLEATDDYGGNKVKCEDILMAAHQAGDFALTTIRPSYVYGEGSNGVYCNMGWNPPTYLDRFRKGKPIVIHGDGNVLSSATFSTDVATAFINAIGNERTYGKAYNASSREWLTYKRYVQGIAMAMGVPCPEFVHIPSNALDRLDPDNRYHGMMVGNAIFDASAADRDLNFAPKVKWVEGLQQALEWMEANDCIVDSDTDPGYDDLIDKWRNLCAQL